MSDTSARSRRTWLLFGAWAAVCCLVFLKPLWILIRYALSSSNGSHILVIPLFTGWLLYLNPPVPDAKMEHDRLTSFFAGIPAIILAVLTRSRMTSEAGWGLAGQVLALILLLYAGFAWVFGRAAAKRSWFPFAFAAFAIPLPAAILDKIVYGLQLGSAQVAAALFDWSGVPVLRNGFVFQLPSFSIEVASECSGIRSSIALLILAVLIAHFSFKAFWKKFAFVLAGLLMMLVKNGVRIATLTVLAQYVDRDFLFGRLHHDGGVVFFLLGMALLLPVYWLLRKGESPGQQAAGA